MKEQLYRAKADLEGIGESVLSEIQPMDSDNPVGELKNKVIRLKSFLDVFSEKVSDKSNEILSDYESQFGEESANDFREKLIKLSQSIISDFSNRILNF